MIERNLQYRKDIDGLRAIAVLSVLGFHAGMPGCSGGYVGVDVFFVISGYLICSILVREIEQDRFSIARFYERRARRILPALTAVLAFCCVAGVTVLSPTEASQLGKSMVATALSASNLLFYKQGNYFDHGILNPLLMTWSLAVEEQFYLVFPLLMLLLYKRSRRHLFAVLGAGCVLSLLFSIGCEFRHPEFNFYLPLTRAWELGAGTMLAVFVSRKKPQPHFRGHHLASVTGLLLIVVPVVFYTPATRFPGYEALPPVLGTVLLLLTPMGVANRVLRLRFFTAIGLISYSLYLWHWPLLSVAAIADSERTSPRGRVAILVLAFAAATLSYFFIETPFRKGRDRRTGRVLLRYGAVIVLLIGVGLALVKTRGFPQRAPKLAEVERSLHLDRPAECIDSADRGPILSPACVPQSGSTPVVALLGDSHAEAMEATLREAVNRSGDRLLTLTSYSCPPLAGITRSLPDSPTHAETCAAFNAQALSLVTHRPDVATVVLAGSWAMAESDRFVPVSDANRVATLTAEQSRANLVQGLKAEVSALEAAGKDVVLCDDWPSLPFIPLDRVKASQLPVRRALAGLLPGAEQSDEAITSIPRPATITPAAEAVRGDLLAFAVSDPRLQVIDAKNVFCTPVACSYLDGEHLLYVDGNHVSHFGAERILSSFHGAWPDSGTAPQTSAASRTAGVSAP